MAYIPNSVLWDKIQSLVQGFIISKDSKHYSVNIKLEPTIINSLIDGCLIEIGLLKSFYGTRQTMLLIEDIPGQPFFAIGENFSSESTEIKDYEEIVIDLFNQNEIILALYNLDSMPVHSKVLNPLKNKTKSDFINWTKLPPSNHKNLRVFDDLDVFTINLNNKPLEENQNRVMRIFKPEPYAFKKGEFKIIETVDNEVGEGKHGYSQEYSIRNFVIDHFEMGVEYFESPLKENKEEITDSIIVLESSIILIESKYVISEKQNKKNQALKKAINQLNNAEKYIKENGYDKIEKNTTKIIIKICIVDTKLVHYYSNFSKDILEEQEDCPIIFTVSSFIQLLGHIIIEDRNNFKPKYEKELLKIWNTRDPKKPLFINPV